MRARFQLPVTLRRLRRRRGFTLVEVAFASACSAIIVTAVLTTFFFLTRAFAAVANHNEMHQQTGAAVAQFSRDMHEVINVGSFTANFLQVTVPTNYTSNGSVGGTKTIRYTVSNGALYRTDSLIGGPRLLATNVTALTFSLFNVNDAPVATNSLNSARTAALDLRLRKRVQGKINEEARSVRVSLRNMQ
jgi:type II secretory pathway pseudopilin PulG